MNILAYRKFPTPRHSPSAPHPFVLVVYRSCFPFHHFPLLALWTTSMHYMDRNKSKFQEGGGGRGEVYIPLLYQCVLIQTCLFITGYKEVELHLWPLGRDCLTYFSFCLWRKWDYISTLVKYLSLENFTRLQVQSGLVTRSTVYHCLLCVFSSDTWRGRVAGWELKNISRRLSLSLTIISIYISLFLWVAFPKILMYFQAKICGQGWLSSIVCKAKMEQELLSKYQLNPIC